MAEKKSDTSSRVKNSLLTAADFGFPYENFTAAAVLMPVTESNASSMAEDVGEVDSFVGQAPPITTPSFGTSAASSISKASQELARGDTRFTHPPANAPVGFSESKPTFTFFGTQLPTTQDPFSFSSVPTATSVFVPSNSPVTLTNSSVYASQASTSPSPAAGEPVDSKPIVSSSAGPSFAPLPAQSCAPVSSVPPPGSEIQHVTNELLAGVPPATSTPPVGSCSPIPLLSTSSSPKPIPLPVATVAPLGSGTNTYRLGSQRKLQYAQPPGLFVSSPAPPSYAPASIQTPASIPSLNYSTPLAPPESSVQSFPRVSSPAAQFVNAPLDTISGPLLTDSSPFLVPASESLFSSTPLVPSAQSSVPSQAPLHPSLQAASPSVSSYFPSPIVAAATAMAATVAAANGHPQYQTPSQTPTDSSVLPASFNNLSQGQPVYRPVYHHWFLKKEVESKVLWQPFSMSDSLALEEAFTSTEITPDTMVATDGGRYDVNILRRQRTAVYWDEDPSEVRRCSWFYKGAIDSRYVPYEESVATKLEEEFKIAMTQNEWHRRVELSHGETVVFHGPNVMVHFPQATSPDAWGNTPVPTRPRVVKRGVDEFNIEEGEPPTVDHLLFLVHGVGSACDLKFRTVEEVVDDFRSLSLQLVQSHFRTASEQGVANRIEVLPVSWHSTLHGDDTGIDHKLKSITLPSIPKLRHFTNDTLLDILFYTSPVFCETIIHTVGNEINRLYELFRNRHPNFEGGVSLGGHSLGSLILFDLLCHQKLPQSPSSEKDAQHLSVPGAESGESTPEEATVREGAGSLNTTKVPPHLRRLNHRVSYVMGNAGTGQPFISYPQLSFHPKAFFAMGSPIGMFVTVRGIDALGEDFRLPTCSGFFNIFHPFDPVAYRIETLINSDLTNLKPVMIPHHKGRKRMHLELKETMARVGADLKQKFIDSVKSTWNTVYQLAMFHRSDTNALEQEVDKVIEEHLQQHETESSHSEEPDPDVVVGRLNGGRRVDYVLQEAPLESFNEYLFALGSHVCYWESEDTMLMILKEVYATMGISSDNNVPVLNSAYERPLSSSGNTPDLPSYQDSLFATPSSSMSHFLGDAIAGADSSCARSCPSLSENQALVDPAINSPVGMDPTAPPSENRNLGPPPISGFVRK